MRSVIEAFVIVVAALGQVGSARERAKDMDRAAKLYDNGARHESIMSGKMSFWARRKEEGVFAAAYRDFPAEVAVVRCRDGVAKLFPGDPLYEFRCLGLDLYDFKSHATLGSDPAKLDVAAGSWGWTSEEGRELVAIGQFDGVSFSEVTAEGKLVYLGRLPPTRGSAVASSLWREMKGYKNYLVIGSESVGHGVQIFDWTKLLALDPASPRTFADGDLTALFDGLPVGRSHNVAVNEEAQYGLAVGSAPRTGACAAGLIFFNLTDPSKPNAMGCVPDDGYVHDVQCLIYRGPDKKYVGRDICYGYNEDTLTIYDVTDKSKAGIISITAYDGASYTHQGWVLDTQWQDFLLLDDEYDEYDGAGPGADGYPVTFIWNISSLEKPVQTGYYKHQVRSVDHNLFIHDGIASQSNYGAGLSLLDVSSIRDDPSGAGVSKVGWFDVYPEDDKTEGGGVVDFVGTWSHYPFFKSGYVVVNTIERGAYVVKRS